MQGIIDEIWVQIDNIWRRARHLAFQLEISWVKGHSGVEGNEKVDWEVKDAAKGHTSQERNLPSFLTKGKLPVSMSDMQQAFDVQMLEEWKTKWALSPHHARLSRINPAMPSRGFQRLVVVFSSIQTSILVQLRTGHMPLSKHLFQISKASSPVCSSCRQGEESIHHYLFECITW